MTIFYDAKYRELMASASEIESKIKMRILTEQDETEKRRLKNFLSELVSAKKKLRERFRENYKKAVLKRTSDIASQINAYTQTLEEVDVYSPLSKNKDPLKTK